MAVSQISNVTLTVNSTLSSSFALSTIQDHLLKTYATVLAAGTGTGQANNFWYDQRTLAASGTENLDFAAALTNSLGSTLTFTKIKALIFYAAAANTNNVLVSRPASNGLVIFSAAGDEIVVQPGGMFVLTAPQAGHTVTAATGDLLTITNSAGTTGVTYDVIAIGLA